MDSANNSTGSMQSSSTGGGGDEEYDSRAAADSSSLSAFLNNNNNNVQPPPAAAATNHVGLFNHHLNAHHVFDPFSNYFMDSIPQSSSSNLDMVWSRAPRSEPNQTFLGNNQAFLLSQFAGSAVPATTAHRLSENNATSTDHQAQSNNSNSNNNNAVRNPKKRSRASRRAPTTVLTTDTTNFRAMVQEFTGIPAPPFTSSSHFASRTRLDLFGASSAPPYLLRPFAQKIQPPPAENRTNSSAINYQHLPVNMQNINFQSILQAPHQKFGNSSSLVASKTQNSLEIPPAAAASVDSSSHLKMGVMEGLGLMSHGHVSIRPLHQNMVPSSSSDHGAFLSRVNNIQNSLGSDWALRTPGAIGNNIGHGVLGSLIGEGGGSSNIPERVPNGDGSYSASPLDFQGEKGPRNEGTVESWINCSSE